MSQPVRILLPFAESKVPGGRKGATLKTRHGLLNGCFKPMMLKRTEALQAFRIAMNGGREAQAVLGLRGQPFQDALAINRGFESTSLANVLERSPHAFLAALTKPPLSAAAGRRLASRRPVRLPAARAPPARRPGPGLPLSGGRPAAQDRVAPSVLEGDGDGCAEPPPQGRAGVLLSSRAAQRALGAGWARSRDHGPAVLEAVRQPVRRRDGLGAEAVGRGPALHPRERGARRDTSSCGSDRAGGTPTARRTARTRGRSDT